MTRSVADPLEELSRWVVLYLVAILTVPIAGAWVWLSFGGHWGVFVLIGALAALIVYSTSRVMREEPGAESPVDV